MKRFSMVFALMIVLAVGLSACGENGNNSGKDTSDSSQTTAGDTGDTEQTEAEEPQITGNPSPDDMITLPFSSDRIFDPYNYKDLKDKGNISSDEIGHMQEGVSDLMLFDPDNAGIIYEYIYGDCQTQVFYNEPDFGTRIVSANAFSGNPDLDEFMNSYGYKNYNIDFYYTHSVWRDPDEDYNEPVCVNLNIDGSDYMYLFADGMLAYREGPDGSSENPETNDFMKEIYKLGCDLGNRLYSERDRYSLFITSMDAYEKTSDSIIITAGIQGREGTYSFVVDSDTEFSKDCDLVFFDDYKQGETPLEWFSRMYDQVDPEDMSLMGVLEISTKHDHVNSILGIYWWD